MALKQYVQWQEAYVSFALNRKLSGVIPPGVYRGFDVAPSGGRTVSISPDAGIQLAVVERGGYNFSVGSTSMETFTVPSDFSGEGYIVIDAEYKFNGGGIQIFKAVADYDIEEYQIKLAKIIIPEGTVTITSGMIDNSYKDMGNWWHKVATTEQIGLLEIATEAETYAGESEEKAVVPKFLKSLYALSEIEIDAGIGLDGGGSLASNRTISLGTPSTVNGSTPNRSIGTTHTHEVSKGTETVYGVFRVATATESLDNTNDSVVITPKKLRDSLGTTGPAPIFSIRAWGNFTNLSTTPSLYAGGNVDKIEKISTGKYKITFKIAMPDAKYAVFCNCDQNNGTSQKDIYAEVDSDIALNSVSIGVVVRESTGGTFRDPKSLYISIVR